MKRSIYPKALLYKEWVQKRWIALLVFLLICPSAFLNTLTPLGYNRIVYGQTGQVINGVTKWGAMHATDVWALNFSDFCSQVLGRYTVGWWASLVVVGLALYTLWSERNHDTWTFTLSGPISKRQLLRTKCTFDAAMIVCTFTVIAIGLWIIDIAVGLQYPIAGIVRWWFAELAIQGSMYALALFFGMLFGNVLAVGLVTFAIAMVPLRIYILLVDRLRPVAFDPTYDHAVSVKWKVMWIFAHLSPLNWFNEDLGKAYIGPLYFMGWFMISAFGLYVLAQLLYQRIQPERTAYLFTFRETKYPLAAVLSAGISFVMVDLFIKDASVTTDITLFVLITVFLWAAAFLVGKRLIRRFD